MADPRKTLRIKTGVVKRLAKEKVSYEKEAGEQRQRIQIYKDQGNYVAPSHLSRDLCRIACILVLLELYPACIKHRALFQLHEE